MLTIKELASYLPYEVKVIDYNGDENYMTTLAGIQNGKVYDQTGGLLECFKLLLLPLSDLVNEIEHNGERFVPSEWFEIGDDDNNGIDYGNGNVKLVGLLKDMAKYNFIQLEYMPYSVVQKLLEWHFDIHNLIPRGLAIDLNTIK